MPKNLTTSLESSINSFRRVFQLLLLSVIVLTLFTAVESYSYPRITSNDLNLIPFPKQVKVQSGEMAIKSSLKIKIPNTPAVLQAVEDLKAEIKRSSGTTFSVTPVSTHTWMLTLSGHSSPKKPVVGSYPKSNEGYVLSVRPECAAVASNTEAGLLNGIRTLQQLVRTNTVKNAIPCLEITDWPSIKYRGFQDDITRSISPTLNTLKREVEMSALLRSNFFTYYLEHQYAFKKHPIIGPENGSLKPEELKELVRFAKLYNIDIIGCQQSFGHWATILRHDQYKNLRETDWVLNPTAEATYQMLDDLYSEQAPLTSSSFFNVCCDETEGLGAGPSKSLAEKIGVGGVYAGHMKRIHQILKDKYNKRMMMWGDIILQHPESLKEIPKDTIMLSWGYHAADTFEPAIKPFADSGYDFFVCPGVNNWSRIIPDFTTATTNIRNYIRDGAKLGAMGVLNTTWDDDAETFFAYNWHGVAWGAECAWNASTTPIGDFNRRIGAILFGNKNDHFGKAIELLGKTHSLPGYNAMFDSRFWQFDGGEYPSDRQSARRQAERLLEIVNPAIDHLLAAKKDAVVNADLLDYFIYAAERMKLIATRTLDYMDAAEAYEEALDASSMERNARPKLDYAISRISTIRNSHIEARNRFKELWLRESRPYALDMLLARYDSLINRYADILTKLEKAKLDTNLPQASEVGMQITEMGVRNCRASIVESTALNVNAAWSSKEFTGRIGISVGAGGVDRIDQPVELILPKDVKGDVMLAELDNAGTQHPILAQTWKESGHTKLAFIVTGSLTPQKGRQFFLYYGGENASINDHPVKLTSADDGVKWIENEQIRLMLGPEGGHIFRWEVKSLGNLDLTQPGDTDWAGFADIHGANRNLKNRIDVITSGDVLVRLRSSDSTGLEKTFSIWAGVSWVEVNFNVGSSWFACYDNLDIMGAGTKTPGSYMFSDGASGAVKPYSADPSSCQIRRQDVSWAAKFVKGGPIIALITPEVSKEHIVGPGGGMGAVQTESGYPAAHFVIYGGKTPDTPKETLDLIRNTLDYRKQPDITLFNTQKYPQSK